MKTSIFFTMFALLFMSQFSVFAQTGYKVGDEATDFSLKNVDGKMVSMNQYTDAKGIILIFTCNHCPFSQAYEDRIKALHVRYAPMGFPVVAVNSNDAVAYPADSYENMIERAQEKQIPYAYLYDETQEYAKRYGATKTPHVFLLTKKGNHFTVAYIGAIDDNGNEPELVKTRYVENAMAELLAGKPVSQNATKAIGCSIKWKAQ